MHLMFKIEIVCVEFIKNTSIKTHHAKIFTPFRNPMQTPRSVATRPLNDMTLFETEGVCPNFWQTSDFWGAPNRAPLGIPCRSLL